MRRGTYCVFNSTPFVVEMSQTTQYEYKGVNSPFARVLAANGPRRVTQWITKTPAEPMDEVGDVQSRLLMLSYPSTAKLTSKLTQVTFAVLWQAEWIHKMTNPFIQAAQQSTQQRQRAQMIHPTNCNP